MNTRKPYRFLDDPDAIALLNDAFTPLQIRVRDYVDPDNAYEPAVIELESGCDSVDKFIVQCDRNWWPDGTNYEDSQISLKLNDMVLGEVDVANLLQTRLSLPLSQHIVGELAVAGQNAR